MTLDTLKKNWAGLLQIAAWLMSLFAPFVFPPPVGLAEQIYGKATTVGYQFGQFILIAVVGLVVIGLKRARLNLWTTLIVTLAALGVGSMTYFSYVAKYSLWTVPYDKEVYVRGEKLKPAIEKNQQITEQSAETLLFSAAGIVTDIWADADTMIQRWRDLVILFTVTVSLFSLSVLMLIQAMTYIRP